MAKFKNPSNAKIVASPEAAGAVVVNPQVFDVAAAKGYRPSTVPTAGDLIEIGVVPTGCVLIPHLSCIRYDALAGAAGQVQFGTEAAPTALAAATALTAAGVLSGEDLGAGTVIGSKTAPTPIYAKVSTTFDALDATGAIRSDLAVRAWDSAIDG